MGMRARMKYADLINSNFVFGEVNELRSNAAVLTDGQILPFDIAVVATGSSYANFPVAKSKPQITIEGRKAEFAAAHNEIENAGSVLIIGGGPVGVEFAGEIADHYPQKSVTIAQGTDRLLDNFSPKANRLAEKYLTSLAVKMLLNTRLNETDDAFRKADTVTCVGQQANTALMRAHFAGSLTDQGQIKVDAKLRVKGVSNVYALGDCSTAPGLKLSYLADVQGVLLAKNIIAQSQGNRIKGFKKPADMALVPIGRKKGFVQLPIMVTSFRPLVNIKQKNMFIAKQYGNLGLKG